MLFDTGISNYFGIVSFNELLVSSLKIMQVVGSPEETSRLLLCEATATVMRKCFHLLGIVPVYKIWYFTMQIHNPSWEG